MALVYALLTYSFLSGSKYQSIHVAVNTKGDYQYDILERVVIVLVSISHAIMLPILEVHIYEMKNFIACSQNAVFDKVFIEMNEKLRKLKFFVIVTFILFLIGNLTIYWSTQKSFFGVISVIS